MRLGTQEPLQYLNEAVAAAAALKAAARLGVLDQLDAGVATVQELAAACGIDEAGAERLLNALVGLGLLEFYEGRWRSLQSP
jgi:DNA-binding IclR family transcriptional regulator